MTDSPFQLEVTLRGPERTLETTYGPRTERDTLARLEVPVAAMRGWSIYQESVRQAVESQPVVVFGELPEEMTAEEAERFRTEWAKRLA